MIKRYIEKIQRFRLLDDTFFNSCLHDNIEGLQLMLRIIKNRKDLRVTKIINQNDVPNIYGREVCFDVFAEDSEGAVYEFEIQRSDKGAVPKRAMATCRPIASAISLPENQRTMALETVMPHIS